MFSVAVAPPGLPLAIHPISPFQGRSPNRRVNHFSFGKHNLAPPGSHYTHRVISLAVRLVVEDGLPYRAASWHLWRDHRVFVPFATLQNWVEAAGGKRHSAR
jgi:hypothetical protein